MIVEYTRKFVCFISEGARDRWMGIFALFIILDVFRECMKVFNRNRFVSEGILRGSRAREMRFD